ncbi:MAG: PDGLE domain-containing protein [Acidobacteriota bacterium]
MRWLPDQYRKLWLGLGALVLLSPLGLILPAMLNGGSAWGEWTADELRQTLGFAPEQLQKLESLWTALLPDYTLPGVEGAWQTGLSYILSGALGVGLVAAICLGLGRWLASGREEGGQDVSGGD